jgi:transketolase
MALSDPSVVVVVSDPASDFMTELAAKHPERLMIEGVCEQAIVGVSAGLASSGFYPFVFMLAVFGTRRCYEQLLLDFGLHRLSGCVVGTGGGLTYAPLGPTHIAVDDLLLVSSVPRSAVLAPAEPKEAVQLARHARSFPGLSFMRLSGTTAHLQYGGNEVTLGRGRVLAEPGPILFVSCGATTLVVEQAVTALREGGIRAGLLHLHTVKPLDVELLLQCASAARAIICVEEHRKIGGLSSAVLHALATTGHTSVMPSRFVSVGIDDTFPEGNGDYEELMSHYGISAEALAERARKLLADL